MTPARKDGRAPCRCPRCRAGRPGAPSAARRCWTAGRRRGAARPGGPGPACPRAGSSISSHCCRTACAGASVPAPRSRSIRPAQSMPGLVLAQADALQWPSAGPGAAPRGWPGTRASARGGSRQSPSRCRRRYRGSWHRQSPSRDPRGVMFTATTVARGKKLNSEALAQV